MSRVIDADWVSELSAAAIRQVLLEYRFLVHRFPQWLLLVAGRCEDERVRQLLIPNIVEECGEIAGALSHLSLLDLCLSSLGVKNHYDYSVSDETRNIEGWFYRVFLTETVYRSLCVLGPGTEAISEEFLWPLERAVRRNFDGVDLRYFDAHRPAVEGDHAEAIEAALLYYEEKATSEEIHSLSCTREEWTRKGQGAHAYFWEALKDRVHSGSGRGSFSGKVRPSAPPGLSSSSAGPSPKTFGEAREVLGGTAIPEY